MTVQRRGLHLIERALWRVARDWSEGIAAAVRPMHEELAAIYRRVGALSGAGVLHFAGWVASSVEAWIALHLMGVNPGIAAVIAIESLLSAIRSIAFAVP